MKFCPLTTVSDRRFLASEYKTAREFGNVRLGELHLFLRAGWKRYYIPYRDVRRCFRRVQLIGAPRGGGFEIENLVICGDAGELFQTQTAGKQAAILLMEELQKLVPEAEFGNYSENDDAIDA